MQQVRRQRYVGLLDQELNFTQAAHAVGMSKRTGKVWRHGRIRVTGHNKNPHPQPIPSANAMMALRNGTTHAGAFARAVVPGG